MSARDEKWAVVRDFIAAYNALDMERLSALLAPAVAWGHHGRNVGGVGSAQLLESIERIGRMVPGRYFEPPEREADNGDLLFLTHRWRAVPVEDVPEKKFQKGVPFTLEVASLFIVPGPQIVEWRDWG